MKKIIKFICVLLSCCVILFGCSFSSASAIAGVDDLVVGGVAVMTIGLVGVLGMLSMNSAGLSDALYQAASDARQDVREFATTLFTSYARTQNITAGQAVNLAAQGTSYLEDGTIIFNKAMSDMMSGFIDWAWRDDGGNLIEYGTNIANGDLSVDYSNVNTSSVGSFIYNWPIVLGTSFQYSTIDNSSNYSASVLSSVSPVYCSWYIYGPKLEGYNVSKRIFFYSENPFTYVDFYGNVHSSNSTTNYDLTYYYCSLSVGGRWDFTASPDYSFYYYTSNAPFTSAPNIWNTAYMIFHGSIIDGSEPVYDVNLDVLDNIQNDTDVNLLNPNDFITVSDAPVGGGTINIQDWLNALADVSVGQSASIPVESDGVITEAVGELAGTDDIAVTQDAIQAGSQAVADSTSVSGLDEFAIDLTDFFPFCIPFDIYDMLSMFAASREAPHFDYRFYIPGICDETITIDLSPFDSVALVLRRVELVAFAIGLAFVTKKLIQGGD